jgi:hypothetical protein
MLHISNPFYHLPHYYYRAEVCVRLFLSLFPHVSYSYTVALEKLRLHSLRTRRHHLEALFVVQAYRGLKSCTSFLENVSLRVPTRHVRDFSIFSVSPSNKHCPVQYACAANVVGKDLDVLYLQSERFLFIIFYNFVLKLLIIFKALVLNPYVQVLCSF